VLCITTLVNALQWNTLGQLKNEVDLLKAKLENAEMENAVKYWNCYCWSSKIIEIPKVWFSNSENSRQKE